MGFRPGRQPLDAVEVGVVDRPSVQTRALGRGSVPGDLAGEQAAREWEERDEARARGVRRRESRRFRPHGAATSTGSAPRRTRPTRSPWRGRGSRPGSSMFRRRESCLRRRARRARRSFPRAASRCPPRDVGRDRRPRSEVGAAMPRALRGDSSASRAARAVAHLLAELRREHHVAAASTKRAAEQLFAPAVVAVDVGGVEERDAGVERGVDHCARCRLVDPAAEVVAAEAHHTDGERSEVPRAHREDGIDTVPGHAPLGGLSGRRGDRGRTGHGHARRRSSSSHCGSTHSRSTSTLKQPATRPLAG